MNDQNRFDQFISAYPRQSLQLLVVVIFMAWQSVASVLGIATYFLLIKLVRLSWWQVLVAGMVLCGIVLIGGVPFTAYIANSFKLNCTFWQMLFSSGFVSACLFLFHHAAIDLVSLPFLLAGLLGLIDLIKDNPHLIVMKALQEGRYIDENKELDDAEIAVALKKLREEDLDGTVLGVSKYTGKAVVIPDQFINQVLLVLGTTGAGKTITLRRFYQRAISKGYPLIVVDGKPTDENVQWLQKLSERYNRKFYGFNCGSYSHYDPLANGGYTELKDKIISLKDQWENDYYRSIAEDYLQTTFEVLLKSGQPFDLKRVVECLNHDDLVILARGLEDEALLKRAVSLSGYDRKDITGLQAHLNLLIHSELGQYFIVDENALTLSNAIAEDAVVYFALPALRFPSFSKVLGKLVINDLKAVIDRHNECNKRVFMVFDEFSVFAGEQVLNLVNMGRGKGVHAIFGTQGLADLEKVDVTFKSQVLNCANTLICHRLNDQESAETVSAWMGTKDAFTVTAQVNVGQSDGGLGSVRMNKEYLVHPEAIKQGLRVGEAFCVSKVGGYWWGKVCIKCNDIVIS